jgi:hypothetical protein
VIDLLDREEGGRIATARGEEIVTQGRTQQD